MTRRRPAPRAAQLKLNLLLARLPRLRDAAVTPEEAFAGTLHVNEGYEQLEAAYAQAARGGIPALPPCEAYCHSLTDPSMLSDELRAAGAQTLTVFGLHMPARLFAGDHAAAKARAVQATLRSLDSVLAEPIADCLLTGPDGEPCLEARTPQELEGELALPAGHIFHRDLAWPFAETAAEAGRWGVETERPERVALRSRAPSAAVASAGSPGTTPPVRCSPPTLPDRRPDRGQQGSKSPGYAASGVTRNPDRRPGSRDVGQRPLRVGRHVRHVPCGPADQPHCCVAVPERRHRAGR